MTLAWLLACSESSFTQLEQEDVFQQQRLNTVDLLLVVDNSCSMVEEQSNLAGNFESFIVFFEDAEVDWQIGVVTTDTYNPDQSGRLIGGDDEIVLWGEEDDDGSRRKIDAVAYDWDWPVAPGAVFSLDMSHGTATRNDNLDHWCVGTAGTPGAANADCDGAEDDVNPALGKVLVTEFAPDPDGVADDVGEWVELTNISEEDYDLGGHRLGDNGRNAYDFPEGTVLAAGASLVLGRSDQVAEVDLVVGADLTLNNHVLILDDETEGPAEIFSEIVAQGTSGSGLEQGLEAARLALTEPLISTENAGFLRPEANLSILVVSDEEDTSPMKVSDYLRAFADVKGEAAYRDHQLMNVSAVVGDDPPEFDGEPSCQSSNGYADYGHRYVDAVTQTEGLLESICAEDFAPIVNHLGLTLSGLEVEFALSRVPKVETLAAAVYDDASDESKERDLTLGVDYSFVEERNAIRFDLGYLPESQQFILVSYKIQSGT